ncbi:MAG TPA: hypothetical protein VGM56_26105 [Byssovorax sp.]|jgi:hypothetical protein
MTDDPRAARLKELIFGARIGWLLASDEQVRLQRYLAELDEVARHIPSTTAVPADAFGAISANPAAFKPFIQTLALPMTAAIRAAAYCVLSGGEVKELSLSYQRRQVVSLSVAIELSDGTVANFSSTELWDVEFVRHLGLIKLGKTPVIDGYFAFAEA